MAKKTSLLPWRLTRPSPYVVPHWDDTGPVCCLHAEVLYGCALVKFTCPPPFSRLSVSKWAPNGPGPKLSMEVRLAQPGQARSGQAWPGWVGPGHVPLTGPRKNAKQKDGPHLEAHCCRP